MSVTVEFLGAAREVTGSCVLVRSGRTRFLVDCGMFQGGAEADRKNARKFPADPASIAFVLSTHAHIDHSGLLPRLVREGFRGPVFCTPATAELLRVMLPDSGHIQERDAERKNRRSMRAGRKAVPPLYTEADARAVLPALSPVGYGDSTRPAFGVTARFLNAGHILGSSILSVTVRDGGRERVLVFSGDIGHRGLPIVMDPETVDRADVLVIESTYGNRVHKGMKETVAEFLHAVKDTLGRKGGNVIIPAFAVGRAQDIVYMLGDLARRGEISGVTLYIDSPMAAEATRITLRHPDCLDGPTREVFAWMEKNPQAIRVLISRTSEDSMTLNAIRGGAIILAGSGMCEAGRIRHHLRHNLWRQESTVVIVGFQAQGTLGRRIVDRAPRVRIFGEEIAVAADIYTIGGLSAHADREDLLHWAGRIRNRPGTVLVAHGEESVALGFARTLEDRFSWNASVPYPGRPIAV
jgi:metallo-beta-lactamase family protein